MKPLGRRVLVQRKSLIREGKIHLPDSYWQQFFYGVVLDTGGGCDKSLYKDVTIWAEWNGNVQQLEKDIYLIDESSILLRQYYGRWVPLRNNILIRRDNKEEVSPGGIIITDLARQKTQSLFGTVISKGLGCNINVEPGDYIHLTDWDVTHKEIGIMGNYDLIVNQKFIACKICSHSESIQNH